MLLNDLPYPLRGKLFVGTAGWSYDSWVGPFYPEGTPARDYLKEYSTHFSSVEIDSTFYRIPNLKTVKGWDRSTPPGFVFAPKFPRVITHEKRLRDCDHELTQFLRAMETLGGKLGPLVLQFDYTFQGQDLPLLARFLQTLPKEKRYAVEVRHRSWLKEPFFQLLTEQGVGLVLADLYYMPRLTRVTADFAYIRLLGNRKQVPDEEFSKVVIRREKELQWWAERVHLFLSRGFTVYLFSNNRYEGHAPATVEHFLEILEEKMGDKFPEGETGQKGGEIVQ